MAKMRTITYCGEKRRIPKFDNQRSKVYEAEKHAFGYVWDEPFLDRDISQISEYVRSVTRSVFWSKIMARTGFRSFDIQVSDGRGCTRGLASVTSIKLPRFARTKPYLIHEMAHSCSPGAQHNWMFCRHYIELVDHLMGDEWARKLRKSFSEFKVKHRVPRMIGDDEMAKLVERGKMLAKTRQS